jgi:mannitol/fructose-specific phosphotransferase system IIA component (Ntr-type)
MKIRESLAVASGMSSSGAMGIILGIFALQNGLISSAIFEAIVITAVTTSLISGPLMKFFLKQKESLKLIDLLDNGLYIRNLKAQNAIEAIILMSRKLGNIDGISGQEIAEKVISRENMMSTGIGNSIAVPHARFYNLKKTVIIAAQSESGIDFNAVDGKDARLIFMILTPFNDQQSQIQILADISGIFQNKEIRERTISAKTYNEFIAAIKPSYFKQ